MLQYLEPDRKAYVAWLSTATDCFRNPQRPLNLRRGNRSSCPFVVILLAWSRLSPLGCKAVVRVPPIVARGVTEIGMFAEADLKFLDRLQQVFTKRHTLGASEQDDTGTAA